jgi:hypothetical protein
LSGSLEVECNEVLKLWLALKFERMFLESGGLGKSALRIAYRYWPVGAEAYENAPPDRGMASPRRFDSAIKHLIPHFVPWPLPLLYPSLTNGPLLTALLDGPGFGRTYSSTTFKPLQSLVSPPWPAPYSWPQSHALIRPSIVTLSRRRLATDVDVDDVPEPTGQRPPADAIPLASPHCSCNATWPIEENSAGQSRWLGTAEWSLEEDDVGNGRRWHSRCRD